MFFVVFKFLLFLLLFFVVFVNVFCVKWGRVGERMHQLGKSMRNSAGARPLWGCGAVADHGKHAGSFSFACEEFVGGAWRLSRGEFEGGECRQASAGWGFIG